MSLHGPIENRFMFWKMIKSEKLGKSGITHPLTLKALLGIFPNSDPCMTFVDPLRHLSYCR